MQIDARSGHFAAADIADIFFSRTHSISFLYSPYQLRDWKSICYVPIFFISMIEDCVIYKLCTYKMKEKKYCFNNIWRRILLDCNWCDDDGGGGRRWIKFTCPDLLIQWHRRPMIWFWFVRRLCRNVGLLRCDLRIISVFRHAALNANKFKYDIE